MSASTDKAPSYRGRFAPSPTGPLHFGSLVAAVGSYLQARCQGGEWLVRIEDLDPPREVAGTAELILHNLEAYGLYWDGTVIYQSGRSEFYLAALQRLESDGRIYPCTCSRQQIAERIRAGNGRPGVYPGSCRAQRPVGKSPHALRINTEGQSIQFTDRLQGAMRQHLQRETGDFVLRRSDGLFAYQLAVVVDDALQGITEVVRGGDLLSSTAAQIFLQRQLELPTPGYLHLPIAANQAGEKLSKQTHALPLDLTAPVPTLYQALRFLGQQPPPELREADLDAFWKWAQDNWQVNRLPKQQSIPVTDSQMEIKTASNS